jgi:hypothetical protein
LNSSTSSVRRAELAEAEIAAQEDVTAVAAWLARYADTPATRRLATESAGDSSSAQVDRNAPVPRHPWLPGDGM